MFSDTHLVFSTAEHLVNKLYREIFSLKIFPYRFPMFNETYRVLTINKKYRLFYRIDEESETVIIARLFSTFENYDNFFERDF